MTVTSEQGRRGPRWQTRHNIDRCVRFFAGIGNHRNIGCHNNDLATVSRGILERCFFVKVNGVFQPPPLPNGPRVFTRLCRGFRKRVLMNTPHLSKLSVAQFVQYYKGKKRTIYMNAAKSLEARPINRKDANVRLFIKIEKLDLTAKPDPAPRVIQPMSVRYNIELGRYLRPIEGVIYKAIDEAVGYPCVCKGLNAAQQGKLITDIWNSFEDPVAIGIDMHRFDQHVSRQALEFEFSFYTSIFDDPHLRMLLSWQYVLKGTAMIPDGFISYMVEIVRNSGAFNTSMGNIILMIAMIVAYLEFLERLAQIRGKLFNNGDDAFIVTERGNLHHFNGMEQFFMQFGFTLVRDDPVYVLEEIKFCQTQPVFDGVQYRMVRDPRIVLSKDLIHISPLDEEDWNARRLAIAQCGLSLAADMPIFRSYYNCLARGASTKRTKYFLERSGLTELSRGMKLDSDVILDETRVSFWRAFGIPPDRQLLLEALYDELTIEYAPAPTLATPPFPVALVAL